VLRISIAVVLGFVMLFGLLEVWHLYAYIILNGVGWVLDNPTRSAIAASSVPKESYQNALALIQLGFGLGRIVIPIVGGIIISTTDNFSINIFLQAAFYSVVLVTFRGIRLERPVETKKVRTSPGRDFVDGLKYVSKQPVTLGLICMGLIPSFFIRPFEDNMLPVFARQILDQDATGLGILLSAGSVGMVLGTFLMASLGDIRRKGLALIASALIAGLGLVALSRMEVMALAAVCLVVIGASVSAYHLLNSTIIMTITPDHYRGRVSTLFMMDQSGAPLGGLLAGGLAAWLRVDWAMLAGGVTTVILVSLFAIRFKALRTAAEQPFTAEKKATTAD
jgi:MFS family permease